MNKLVVWGTIFLIVGALVFPIVYFLFSVWWLLTGDMVTRTIFFISSLVTTCILIGGILLTSQSDNLKKLFKL